MKLIVAADTETALIAVISLRTEWQFGMMIEEVRRILKGMPDMYPIFAPSAKVQTVPPGIDAPEPIVEAGGGISFANVSAFGVDTVSFPIHSEPIPPTDRLVPPVLPTTDTRPSMDLDPEPFEMKDAVIALAEHTKESRKPK